jgi:hypothetical protein
MAEEKTPGKHLAILRVSQQLLVQALHLPPDTVVDAAKILFHAPDTIELRVEHADLPLSPIGNVIPVVSAEFRTEHMEGQVREIVFVRWVL